MRRLTFAAVMGVLLAAPACAGAAQWYAGDGHVHTCYSHDAYCGPGDDEGEDAFYSFGGTVTERFAEASLKGLEFLVISDHEDIRAQADPGFGTQGVTGIHAYEASLNGHAQMIGALKKYPEGNKEAPAISAMADALRADGGVFQANHPAYRLAGVRIEKCEQAGTKPPMDWSYGYSVLPDTIEVWNATTLVQPSELFWDCWLQRGARIGALGGSDSHGANHVNIGLPTTWVYAASQKEADVVAAIRAGRTTLSRVAPNQGAVRLLLEGDRDRNGSFESMIGDQVPPGTPLRVRAEGLPGPGRVRVRVNGKTRDPDLDPLSPGGEIRFDAPADPGWVRATLYLSNGTGAVDPSCAPPKETGSPPISTCTEDLAIAAMTSPIWVDRPVEPPVDTGGGPKPSSEPPPPEPDSQPPLPPSSEAGPQPPPDVPPQRPRPARVDRLRATWFHAARASHRSLRVRLRWNAPEGPFEVQVRRRGSKKWRVLAERTRRRATVVRLKRGAWVVRVRARPGFAEPSAWRSLTVRM